MSTPVHLRAEYNNTTFARWLAALVASTIAILVLFLPLPLSFKSLLAMAPLAWWGWFIRSLIHPVSFLHYQEEWFWADTSSSAFADQHEAPVWHSVPEPDLLWRDGRLIVLAFSPQLAAKPQIVHMYLTPSSCGERLFRQIQRHFLYEATDPAI